MINNFQQRISGFFYPNAAWFGLIMVFGLPWSHAFFYIGLVGMLFCLAVSTVHYKDLLSACKEKIALLALLLFLFIAMGWLYTHASTEQAVFDVRKYRKLLLVPIFLMLYSNVKWAKRLVIAYALGVFTLLLPTLLDGTGLMKALSLDMSKYKDGSYTDQSLVYWRNHIVNGFHASFLFAICVISAISYRRLMWGCILISALCVVDIVFFIHGRMALISLFAVCLLLALSYTSRTFYRTCLVLSIFAISATAYQFSGTTADRINSVVEEGRSFVTEKNVNSSGGNRLHYWSMSLTMFMEAPIFGNGPGSFRKNLDQPDNLLRAQPHRHAHNEYLTLLSQHGLIGLVIFLYLTQQIYHKAGIHNNIWLKGIVRAGLLIFLINAATDSSLHNESEGWTFVLLACLASVRTGTKQPTLEVCRNNVVV